MKERNEIESRAGWIGWFVRLVGFRIAISSFVTSARGSAGGRLRRGKIKEGGKEKRERRRSQQRKRVQSRSKGKVKMSRFELLWLWDGMGWDEGW